MINELNTLLPGKISKTEIKMNNKLIKINQKFKIRIKTKNRVFENVWFIEVVMIKDIYAQRGSGHVGNTEGHM